MNVLIAGKGRGSWEMRGVQIGAALGARVRTDPTDQDVAWADVVILLKKYAVQYAPQVHRAGKPIVWDALDFWSQPAQNRLDIPAAVVAFHQMKAAIKPAAVICATQKMADDCGGVYIPHHCRIGLTPTPPRERIQVVAYDGSERYLGIWESAIRKECAQRGWSFVINPPDLSKVDILVAFRDGMWDGPICRAWKSGVKYVNALCAGRPIIGQPCSAWREVMMGTIAIDCIDDLAGVFDSWSRMAVNASVRDRCHQFVVEQARQFTVDSVTDFYYRPLLTRVLAEVPCTAA